MPINRARIQEYLRQGEGAPPPVFVGRGDILRDILTTARESAGQPKMTRAVQGAPGAGKSSLLHEMQRKWTGENGNPRVVTFSSESVIQDTSSVIQAIMAAGISSRDGWRRILRDRIRRLKSVGASVAGYSLSAEFDDYREARLLSTATRRGQERPWKRPVILAVDEAQALKEDSSSVSACFLREIHNAVIGLPLTLVLAGLSDTADRARKMHLTRQIAVLETKPMAAKEAREFMRKLAVWFGLDTFRHTARLNGLADICDGWPRHLRYAGVALAEEALRTNGDMERMDWKHVGNETWCLRQRYYRDQNSPEMQHADILTARVMAGLKDGMRSGQVEELVENSVVDRPRQRLPEGRSALWFINHLIHQGALYRDPDSRVHSPIPSFRRYLIEWGAGHERKTDARNDIPDDNGTDHSP